MTTQNNHDYADHFPRRANLRVPNMEFAADVDTNGKVRMELGKPVAALATGVVNAASIAAALVKNVSAVVANHRKNMGRYGRNVTVVLSGAGTPAIEVFGLDYLGQPMSEQFTGTGSTPVVGKKAFKQVLSFSSGLVAATTINIGYGDILGLPYAVAAVQEQYVDQAVPTAGTVAAAVLSAQTATSGDPRGTYAPHSTALANGSRDFILIGTAIEGDYHGLPHFTN